VLDRNRGGAYLSILIAGIGMFGIFLFLTFYLQQTKGYSPVMAGVAFLPMVAMIAAAANLSNVVLLPRFGPKPLVTLGMLLAATGVALLTRIGVHTSYASTVLPSLLIDGAGLGLVIAPSINTGTYGVDVADAGVASASVNTGQQLGGSIGTSLLNTIAAGATAAYLTAHLSPRTLVHGRPSPALTGQALIHGYITAFWWAAVIFVCGAVVAGVLFRRGPLVRQQALGGTPTPAEGAAQPRAIPG
jgi:Major Facilitator Superfamily